MLDLRNPRKILLMYITKVSGHRAATLALEKSLNQLDPTTEIMSINGFGYTYPLLEKVVNKTYMGIIKRTPKVWDYLYDNPNIVKRVETIKNFLHKTSHSKLSELFEKFQADTVVCTQAFPCGMVADYKKAHNLKFLLVGVLTDYAPHSFWLNEGVDYYVVPSEETRDRFIKKGVASQSIKVFGIPIQSRFTKRLDKKALAQKFGLNVDLPVVLIMGGGQGLGPIKDVVRSLRKLKSPLQMIVLAGTNARLLRWLRKHSAKLDKKIIVYEFADNVDELMEVSTLIITKPGGMTTSEALSKGLPMVIINPLPGQEIRNTDFLLKSGIALRVDNRIDIGEEVELLLKSPEALLAMRKAAYENSHPTAASDVAQFILRHPVS